MPLAYLSLAYEQAYAQEKAQKVPTQSMFGSRFDRVDDKAYVLSSALWKQTTISVCWENLDAAKSDDLETIRVAIENSWAKHSCLRFTNWKACAPNNRGIRILIATVSQTYDLPSTAPFD